MSVGTLSSVLIDVGRPSSLEAVPLPWQGALGGVRKSTEAVTRLPAFPPSSRGSASAPAWTSFLISLRDDCDPEAEAGVNPFLHKLLLVVVFITGTDSKLDIYTKKGGCQEYKMTSETNTVLLLCCH